jgi:hypothetical protein
MGRVDFEKDLERGDGQICDDEKRRDFLESQQSTSPTLTQGTFESERDVKGRLLFTGWV